MQDMPDDCAKRRLTDRAEMVVAVDFLGRRGFADDELVLQLVSFYFVDVDILNEILAERRRKVPARVRTPMRAVA